MKLLHLLPGIAVVLGSCHGSPQKTSSPSPQSYAEKGLTGLYQGTLPCADCGGILTQLQLKRDSSFVLLSTYTATPSGKDQTWPDMGKWSLANDSTLELMGQNGPHRQWHISNDGHSLEKLAADGQKTGSPEAPALQKTTDAPASDIVPVPDTLRGLYYYASHADRLQTCDSKKIWPVMDKAANREVEEALMTGGHPSGKPVYLLAEGYRWLQHSMQGDSMEMCYVITRLIALDRHKGCPER